MTDESTQPADPPQANPDQRDDEALERTRQAQEAHGGSMAPALVDETGHPTTPTTT